MGVFTNFMIQVVIALVETDMRNRMKYKCCFVENTIDTHLVEIK